MKRSLQLIILAASALWLAACGSPAANNQPANNANASNANANTAKPPPAPPTKEALLDMDKKATEAYINGDGKFFEGFLSDKFVMYEGGKRMDKAAVTKMIGGSKCDMKSWSLDDPQMEIIDADTAVVVYKGTFDGTCPGADGKSVKQPSPVRAASVFIRSGDKWLGVYHGEVAIVDPKNPPKAPPAPPANKDAKTGANSNTAETKPAADPNTDAMLAVEKSGWDAWKARDAKKLEDLTAKDLSFVDMYGLFTATKADTIKSWTEGKCDVKNVNIGDAAGTTLSPTVGILTFKGTAEGTCDGQKVKPVYGTSVYLKDGGAWKLAFGVEQPVM